MAVSQNLTLTELSYDIEANTSRVRILWTSTQTGDSHNNNTLAGAYWVSINGATGVRNDVTTTLPANTTKIIADSTITVAHNADGTGIIAVESSIDTHISAGVVKKSAALVLTTIPRSSKISGASGSIGQSVRINLTRYSTSFKHTLTYSFGSLQGTIATDVQADFVDWTIPQSFYTQIPNATVGKGGIYCATYSGNVQIGDTQRGDLYAYTVETDCIPDASVTIVDSNTAATALTGSNLTLIKGVSNAKITTSGGAKNSATIKQYVTLCGDGQALNQAVGTLNAVENGNFVTTVTDSRGYVKRIDTVRTLIQYFPVSCVMTITPVDSVTGVASITLKGNYFNGSFGNATNQLTVQYRYKEASGVYTDWLDLTATLTAKEYAAFADIPGLDYTKGYVFQARAIDKLTSAATKETPSKTVPVFDWGEADFNFNVPIKIKNTPLLDIIYPVGSIYVSTKSTDPQALFGGTWESIKDVFLLAAGDTYKAGATGGESKVTLSRFQLPGAVWASGSGENAIVTSTSGAPDAGYGMYTQAEDWGQAHNNMPPYLAAYVWKRTG